jgi:hypothetical protein
MKMPSGAGSKQEEHRDVVDAEVAEPVTDGPRDEHDVFRAGGEGLVANQELQFAGQQVGDAAMAAGHPPPVRKHAPVVPGCGYPGPPISVSKKAT